MSDIEYQQNSEYITNGQGNVIENPIAYGMMMAQEVSTKTHRFYNPITRREESFNYLEGNINPEKFERKYIEESLVKASALNWRRNAGNMSLPEYVNNIDKENNELRPRQKIIAVDSNDYPMIKKHQNSRFWNFISCLRGKPIELI